MSFQLFKNLFYLLLLAACLSGLNACAQENKASFLPVAKSVTSLSSFYEVAMQQLQIQSQKYDIDLEGVHLAFVAENKDESGNVHVKLQPKIQDIPIWSKQIIVHLDKHNNLYTVSGKLPSTSVSSAQPIVDEQQAQSSAKEFLEKDSAEWNALLTELMFFPNDKQKSLELAYKITLQRGLERQFVFVSALRGDILTQFSGSPR